MINIVAQLLGYLAFIFLAVSLLVNSDMQFRWINSLGSISFIFYGMFINALPVVLTNAVLLAINIYFLFKIYRQQEKFDLVAFKKNAGLIPKFLSFYQKDIHTYFPDFVLEDKEDEIRFIVLRDIVVANIFVAAIRANGDAIVKINYTVPKYRDYKIDRFLFDAGNFFLNEQGIKRIIYSSVTHPKHEKFLRVIGFTKEIVENKTCYVKNI